MDNGQSKNSAKINEGTLLSVHIVLLAIGLTIWLTKLSFQVENSKEEIERLREKCFPQQDKKNSSLD